MSSIEYHNQRLSKFLAYAGIASRRNSEKLIIKGRISVNGVTVIDPATKVSKKDVICLNGNLIKHQTDEARIWLYHKPVGEICSNSDPFGKRTVFDSFPPDLGKVCLVGRLDYNSEGLLLLTNKGFIKRYLELPRNRITRTYRVKVLGRNLNNSTLKPIREGVTISGISYRPMIVRMISKIEKTSWLEISLTEGKNREIRIVLGEIGLKVVKLIRVKYGNFFLGKIRSGQVKEVVIPIELVQNMEN